MGESTHFTAGLAERAAGLRFADLPDDVVELARQCLLDWFGVTLAGANEPAARIVADELAAGGSHGSGVTVVGRTLRLAPHDAALANGTAGHTLDYDDVNYSWNGHPTVAVLPGVLALAESGDLGGRDVITAFVAGYETGSRLGRAMGRVHYQRGFHATGTIGAFGSAAACSRLLGLDAATTEQALGLAGTQAAGLKSMFGTMAKPFHAGKAAANGLLAARLAAGGFTAADGVVETSQGFAETQTDGFDPARGLAEARQGWHLRDNLFKYHAACYRTHSAIEGVRQIVEDNRLDAAGVTSVVIHADDGQMRMCAIPEPRTGLEMKFSLRHTAALVLAGVDTADITVYDDVRAGAAELVTIRDRVKVVPDGVPDAPTLVEVHTADGRSFEAAYDTDEPESDLALQRGRLEQKFAALAWPRLGVDGSGRLRALVAHLDELDEIGAVMRAAVPA
jgi:2-methylcitrate dehydratase PrpD